MDIYTSNSVNHTYTIHTIDGTCDSKDIASVDIEELENS